MTAWASMQAVLAHRVHVDVSGLQLWSSSDLERSSLCGRVHARVTCQKLLCLIFMPVSLLYNCQLSCQVYSSATCLPVWQPSACLPGSSSSKAGCKVMREGKRDFKLSIQPALAHDGVVCTRINFNTQTGPSFILGACLSSRTGFRRHGPCLSAGPVKTALAGTALRCQLPFCTSCSFTALCIMTGDKENAAIATTSSTSAAGSNPVSDLAQSRQLHPQRCAQWWTCVPGGGNQAHAGIWISLHLWQRHRVCRIYQHGGGKKWRDHSKRGGGGDSRRRRVPSRISTSCSAARS